MAQIDFYMGAPIEYSSERATLVRLHEQLSSGPDDAVIFANITIEGRQIDLVAATANAILVIEAKGFTRPLVGGFNGVWRIATPVGPKTTANPYQQALSAKNALRDVMSRQAGEDLAYPDAVVVFVPAIPNDSTIPPGDHKVRLIDLDALKMPAARHDKRMWSIDKWRRFAENINLLKVGTVQALVDAKVAVAENQLREYEELFRKTYEPRVFGLVPFPCQIEGREFISQGITSLIVGGMDGLLIGPAGCGKSLLAVQASLDYLAARGTPFIIEAKHFRGEIKAAIDREAALLGSTSGRDLMVAAQRADRPLLYVIDGYNECSLEHRYELSRAIAALVRRYSAHVLITSQVSLEGRGLLKLDTISVPPPTSQLKATIARAAADADLSPNALAVLGAAASGLEARLIGEVSEQLPPSASRHSVFDAYARKRLGTEASEAIGALASVAGWLSDRMSFSLSKRQLDRLLEVGKRPLGLCTRLSAAGLLSERGDRISFGHELFLSAFTAEAVVRRADGVAASILSALSAPVYAESRALIVGAIDDDTVLASVLESIEDPGLIADCVIGDCGGRAQGWANRKLISIFELIIEEAHDTRFELDDSGWLQVRAVETSLRNWSSQEQALLKAIPTAISSGGWLGQVLRAAQAMDRRLLSELTRHSPEAKRQKVALRTGLFANAYVNQSPRSPALTQISSGLGWLALRRAVSERFSDEVATALAAPDLTPGELYILLELGRHIPETGHPAAPFMVQLFGRHWPLSPYHLRLALLEAASLCWTSPDAVKKELVAALEALPDVRNSVGLSGAWLDAMQSLGALEDAAEEQRQSLSAWVNELLATPLESTCQAGAWSIFCGRFDHPLERAYCEVYDALSDEARKCLLNMAAQAADLTDMFLAPLLIELAEFGDTQAAAPIVRWTEPPARTSFMPGEALKIYLVAHIILGRLKITLPLREAESEAESALMCCAELLYLVNRFVDPDSETGGRTRVAWAFLSERPGLALPLLAECQGIHFEGAGRIPGEGLIRLRLLEFFRDDILALSRHVLNEPTMLVGYFHPDRYDQARALGFALDVLGQSGDGGDLTTLRARVGDARLARSALSAIQAIETRESNPGPVDPVVAKIAPRRGA